MIQQRDVIPMAPKPSVFQDPHVDWLAQYVASVNVFSEWYGGVKELNPLDNMPTEISQHYHRLLDLRHQISTTQAMTNDGMAAQLRFLFVSLGIDGDYGEHGEDLLINVIASLESRLPVDVLESLQDQVR